METQQQTSGATTSRLYVRMIVSAWETQNTRVDKLLSTLTDEQLLSKTAPGRNTGFYILGHLTGVNDNLFPLLGFGDKLYPELQEAFLANPEDTDIKRPTLAQVKAYWTTITTKLTDEINKLTPEEWLTRHTAVSEEDFAKEPTRNKLNLLVNRANHQAYHLGQLTYLVKRKV